MAQISNAVQHNVKQFLDAVSRERQVTAAYIYGSEARQQATEWSDIDVALVSPDFGDDLFLAQVALMKLAARVDERIEPCTFSPESFTINDPLVSLILDTGVRIA